MKLLKIVTAIVLMAFLSSSIYTLVNWDQSVIRIEPIEMDRELSRYDTKIGTIVTILDTKGHLYNIELKLLDSMKVDMNNPIECKQVEDTMGNVILVINNNHE